MRRLSKRDIYRMMIEASSIQSPTLSKHFKYVLIDLSIKYKIDAANRKMNELSGRWS